jgi:transposase
MRHDAKLVAVESALVVNANSEARARAEEIVYQGRGAIAWIEEGASECFRKAKGLTHFRGVGPRGSVILSQEYLGWRCFSNRRQVGSGVGVTPTPYNSGEGERELGINKAGNRRVRAVMIQLAWCWLRFQPESELSRWFQERFGQGKRMRRIGIVALARKLVIAFWKYLERGEIPEGAVLER